MKCLAWWRLWKALDALQALGMLAISGLAWFTGRVQRWADAAEIEMLLARVERRISLKRGAKRGAKAARGGKP